MKEERSKLCRWNWREWFSNSAVLYGEQDEEKRKIAVFHIDPSGSSGWAKTTGGFTVRVDHVPTTYQECADSIPWDWNKHRWSFEGKDIPRMHSCNCAQGMNGTLCRHLACFMIHWEKVRGPFVFTQTAEERKEEIRRLQAEEERKRLEEEKERERKRQEEERRRKEEQRSNALPFLRQIGGLPDLPAGTVFRLDTIFKDIETNEYEKEVYEALSPAEQLPEVFVETDFDERSGEQVLHVSAETGSKNVQMTIAKSEIHSMRCSCGKCSYTGSGYYYSYSYRPDTMCGHAMAAVRSLWNRIAEENPGDETDRKGMRFLSVMAGKAAPSIQTQAAAKRPVVELTPRIAAIRGELQLAFSISLQGERSYVVRGLEKLYYAVEQEKAYELSKSAELDFGKLTFTEEAAKWYDFIATRVRNIHSINRRLESGSNWYHSVKQLSIGAGVPLDGSDLDVVYALAEGSKIAYKTAAGKGDEVMVTAGPGRLGIRIRLTPEKDSGSLTAVRLTAAIPQLLRGNQYQYILDATQFGRISQEEMDVLLPFLDIAGKERDFTCTIGRRKFPEFFYRVLPALQDSVHVEIIDEVGDPGDAYLPPEPAFTFWIDMEGDFVTCRPVVAYGEAKYSLPAGGQAAGRLRDRDQEERILQAVRAYFAEYSGEKNAYEAPSDEEHLVRILTEGVPALSAFGIVKGSDAFGSFRVRPVARLSFHVSLESGILDLSIRTKDMTEEELLALLDSYRKKKRWYRLSSGDFVDLRDASTLEELETLAGELDVSAQTLIREGIRMPSYRALYIDRLLEEHEEIASSRDKHFKNLVRSFRTIRDADYDVPEELGDILRPYQIYGFRWLSTLSGAGFGGILADEMGLGKTIQMLAFLQGQYREGGTAPALVVCPASLVYNWKEECARFTPDIPAVTLAGDLRQRKKEIRGIAGAGADQGGGRSNSDAGGGQAGGTKARGSGWLYITSYDLLKRDITLYEGLRFSTIVLDEAQFIKNRTTAVSKAVKILKAANRFALTGTPIENRLSELWSIFDFLMPGFLYSASEFSSRFEIPVMKKKDQAASGRIAAMTAPFILRRKKADVLKELPDKLEEVRTSSMEGEQRRLYDAQVVHMKKMLQSLGGSGEEKIKVLAEITRLRQICCDPSLVFENYRGSSAKREACMDLIRSAIDGGHRMLVFTQFTSMMALIMEDLKKEGIPFFTITGTTPKKTRLQLVNEFNGGDVPVFLISLRAGGTGLNLTGADVVIHYDPWWNLAVQNQATDRAHRIGQTRQVTVFRLVAAHSIEEKILELQEAKRELADAVIGAEGGSIMNLSAEELLELLA